MGVRMRSALFVAALAAVVALGAVEGARGADEVFSALLLDGSLRDDVLGTSAQFERASVAYGRDGSTVAPGEPRYESEAAVAGLAFEIFASGAPDVIPCAVQGGALLGRDAAGRFYTSTDGEHWQQRWSFSQGICSIYATEGGSILVGTAPPLLPLAIQGGAELWRSADGGGSFDKVLELPVGFAQQFNYASGGETVIVSEYGYYWDTNNARKIYRSVDDGASWALAYDPPGERGYHNHRALYDPYEDVWYQAHGDDTKALLRSTDGGASWEEFHDFYQPMSGLARPEGVYWGWDGQPVSGIYRYDRARGRFELVANPGFFTGDVYDMLEVNGVIYAPFAHAENGGLWLSADGDHWVKGRRFGTGDAGIKVFAGELGGWIYGQYSTGPSSQTVRLRAEVVRTVEGVHIEPGVRNELATAGQSSMEGGLEGWRGLGGATVALDANEPYQGGVSLRVQQTDGPYTGAESPVYSAPLSAGTTVQASVWVRGDEKAYKMFIYDRTNHRVVGSTTFYPADNWQEVRGSVVLPADVNELSIMVQAVGPGGAMVGDANDVFWVDAASIEVGAVPLSWQMGGEPRASETLRHEVAYPEAWTDVLFWWPDHASNVPATGPLTLKTWVEDANELARLIYDPASDRFEIVRVSEGEEMVLGSTPTVGFDEDVLVKLGVSEGADGARLVVEIDADPLVVEMPRLGLEVAEIVVGSDELGGDQGMGVYARAVGWQGARDAGGVLGLFEEVAVMPWPAGWTVLALAGAWRLRRCRRGGGGVRGRLK